MTLADFMIFGNVAGCGAALDINWGMAVASALGGLAGNVAGQLLNSPTRNALMATMTKLYGPSPAWADGLGVAITEGAGSGMVEALAVSPTVGTSRR